jgi:hypothetical protein
MNAKSTRLLLNGEAPVLTIMTFVSASFKPYRPLQYSRKIIKHSKSIQHSPSQMLMIAQMVQ